MDGPNCEWNSNFANFYKMSLSFDSVSQLHSRKHKSMKSIYSCFVVVFVTVVSVMHGPLHPISPNPVYNTSVQIYQAMCKYRPHIRISWSASLNAFPSILKRNSHEGDNHIRNWMAPWIRSKRMPNEVTILMCQNRANHSFGDCHSRDWKKERYVDVDVHACVAVWHVLTCKQQSYASIHDEPKSITISIDIAIAIDLAYQLMCDVGCVCMVQAMCVCGFFPFFKTQIIERERAPRKQISAMVFVFFFCFSSSSFRI